MKILITDYVHPSLITRLESDGHIVEYDRTISLHKVKGVIGDYDGIVINSKIKMDKDTIAINPNLNFIARLGSGMEIVDIPYAQKHNIRVINTPDGNAISVGEHAVGMLLMLANNLRRGDKEVKEFSWNREDNRGWELKGKTIGIIGLGHTGCQLAQKLSGFEMRILGYDKYSMDYVQSHSMVAASDLATIKQEADIISFHLPLTREIMHLCDSAFIADCKKGVVLINTSRGKVIHTPSLIKGLTSGKVGGACLDVFENEKVDTYSSEEKDMYSRLNAFSQVIVSPHVAGWTHESLKRIADLVYERINNGYTMKLPPYTY